MFLGALLIQPEVATFWNMKRELIEAGILNPKTELIFNSLVLSIKSKSNEAFAYRKWCITKILKSFNNHMKSHEWHAENHILLLTNECKVTLMAASKAQNNYHAWTHQIWAVETIAYKYIPNVITIQLDFSLPWVMSHVSEHTGFHYRQHVLKLVKERNMEKSLFSKYYEFIADNVVPKSESNSLLKYLLGENSQVNTKGCCQNEHIQNIQFQSQSINFKHNLETRQQNVQIENYLCILLFELFDTLKLLSELYSSHESVWYHRRFVIFGLLQVASEYHSLPLSCSKNINDAFSSQGQNIIMTELKEKMNFNRFQDNGEICPKLFKSESSNFTSSNLYKLILETERNIILKNNLKKSNYVQKELARRHEKWLKFVIDLPLDI